MSFRFGIEHEVAFQNEKGQYADFSNTSFEALQQIVDSLPMYPTDYPQLRIGDAGIKKKRWYVEGYERFDLAGGLLDCTPKGIEIRTRIHTSIDAAVSELDASFASLTAAARHHGYAPVLSSYNPLQPAFNPEPPLNSFELARRDASPEKQTALIPMMTQGPDLNISVEGLREKDAVNYTKKLTYYSPFIIPFTFSAPFYAGQLWGGLSKRTYERTGLRPAAMVFLPEVHPDHYIVPSLVKRARLAAEVGRIEFKACDSCGDFRLYGALLALMKGLYLDQTLPGRAVVPDADLHKQVAMTGLNDTVVHDQAGRLIIAARTALGDDPDVKWLTHLETLHAARMCEADRMIATFDAEGDILRALAAGYRVPSASSASPSALHKFP